jgi:hypothetical protein
MRNAHEHPFVIKRRGIALRVPDVKLAVEAGRAAGEHPLVALDRAIYGKFQDAFFRQKLLETETAFLFAPEEHDPSGLTGLALMVERDALLNNPASIWRRTADAATQQHQDPSSVLLLRDWQDYLDDAKAATKCSPPLSPYVPRAPVQVLQSAHSDGSVVAFTVDGRHRIDRLLSSGLLSPARLRLSPDLRNAEAHLNEKMVTDPHFRTFLLNTAPARLLYFSIEPVWGCGADGRGANRLGFLLEAVRDRRLAAAARPYPTVEQAFELVRRALLSWSP